METPASFATVFKVGLPDIVPHSMIERLGIYRFEPFKKSSEKAKNGRPSDDSIT
jgi:hypothetical protein